MRNGNLWLLGSVLIITGACGARTGDLGDFEDAGYFYSVGGANAGGAVPWTTGGVQSFGGWGPGGAYPGIGGYYPGIGGYYPATGGYPYTTGTYGCTPGYYGCQCTSGYYCNSPYSCISGWCQYPSYATGGAVGYGGYTGCSQGYYGCSCYAGYYCVSPYSCMNGICSYVPSTATGGFPGYGGMPGVGGAITVPTGGRGVGGAITVPTGGRGVGGGMVTGGKVSYGGAVATGGVSPIVACADSLATCLNDTQCTAVISCLLASTAKCSGDVTCFIAACQSTLTGSSAPLALQIIQDCASFITG